MFGKFLNFYIKSKSRTYQTGGKRRLKILYREIGINELVDAIFSFSGYSAPGEDVILNRDLTILMETDMERQLEGNKEI